MKTWQEIGFQREITRDGSLTLKPAGEASEAMHHSGGALEETVFVYGEPLKEIFSRISRPRIFSLGLGLGYVEFVTAARACLTGKDFEIVTMESVGSLIRVLKGFLKGVLPEGEIRNDLESVLRGVAEKTGVSEGRIFQELRAALTEGRWEIRGAFGSDSIPEGRFHGIMYDAFSSKTSPALWSEEFLSHFFEVGAERDALVSTYACTGNLKRSLKKNGFLLDARSGFQGKRSATLGRRGAFISPRDP
ncbi:MAG TPA: MnmC family methyltransferase [Pseudobdellovibrionaceae bacterium]|nr:MnmC family methyltransferase [Pseudobdellovibrionaceae bacterium]